MRLLERPCEAAVPHPVVGQRPASKVPDVMMRGRGGHARQPDSGRKLKARLGSFVSTDSTVMSIQANPAEPFSGF